jgi:hypothetical protein
MAVNSARTGAIVDGSSRFLANAGNFSYAVLHNEMFDSFASDYSFYRIGSFDSNTGIVKSCEPLPEFLLEASAVFGRVKKDE